MEESFEELHEVDDSEEYTRSYDIRYVSEIRHSGLGTFRVLKDTDQWRLQNKVDAQFRKWDDQWAKIVHKNKSQADREANINAAEDRTLEAQEKQEEIENLLLHTLNVDDTIDWNSLKDSTKFKKVNPKGNLDQELAKIAAPTVPTYKEVPAKPAWMIYEPQFSFLDKLLSSLKEKKMKQAENDYNAAISVWEKKVSDVNAQNEAAKLQYEKDIISYEEIKRATIRKFEDLEKSWEKEREAFYANQKQHNDKISLLREKYLQQDKEAVEQYCEMVLNNSEYPEEFPKDFDLAFTPDNKLLLVEYVLPAPTDLPTLTEVKYIAAKKELKESYLSDAQLAKNYDAAIYKITLRTLHELFEADKANALDAIIFNGWVDAVNKATGKKVHSCIVSIQAKKSEFLEIHLAEVDPKTCFKNLKGVGSSKLSGITAVQPIAQLNKNDKRFVASHDVANNLDEGFNLATIAWEEFEHLLREIFEKEFNTNGGEVKVTQASRDGGVDAVAFDPDPIRGGKIVIQAKRYTNTVGVSAVRDLYGTVMNEGATKGILVTTSDYGPDAYEFAKNKPITLMNGGNLLYLLEKHGHKVRIDLAEAKKLVSEKAISA